MEMIYESPEIEMVEVDVEHGFAATVGATTEGYEDGGTIII